MNIITLLRNIRNTIAASDDIQAWCRVKYGRDISLYLGINAADPPDDDHYPMAYLKPITRAAGYSRDSQANVIGITCGVIDETEEITGVDAIVEMSGVSNLEEFRKLLETAAVTAAEESGLTLDNMQINYETDAFYPAFMAIMELQFNSPYYQGDDVFA